MVADVTADQLPEVGYKLLQPATLVGGHVPGHVLEPRVRCFDSADVYGTAETVALPALARFTLSGHISGLPVGAPRAAGLKPTLTSSRIQMEVISMTVRSVSDVRVVFR
jgi:hypothetical protein